MDKKDNQDRIKTVVSKALPWITIICLVLAAVTFRIFFYGDLRAWIGVNDTPSYIQCSEKPLFSWESFTCRRPFGMSIVFALNRPEKGYRLTAITNPASEVRNPTRRMQYGLDQIVFQQAIFAIFCWSLLAFSFARHLSNPFLKVFSVVFILLFALAPQLTDWDSVLSSESLSFSISALILALLIEMAFWFSKSEKVQWKGILIGGLWIVSLIVFVFVRDSNLYFIPIALILAIPLLVSKKSRSMRIFLITGVLLMAGLFIFGSATARASTRWQDSIRHMYEDFIYPYPARMEFFNKSGMPEPGSQEHAEWFQRMAPGTFVRFLVSYPGFTITTLVDGFETMFSENMQPYFHEREVGIRGSMKIIGDALHPKSSATFLVLVLLTGGIFAAAVKSRSTNQRTWAWILIWAMLVATLTLIVSFFADTGGVLRHVLGSILYYRLLLWLSCFILLDFVIAKEKTLDLE